MLSSRALAVGLPLLLLALGVSCAQSAATPDVEKPAPAPPVAQAHHAARAVRKPASVPDDYVATPSGYLHPSCVIAVADDEVAGDDLVIRGKDGQPRRTVQPCAYPRYSPLGVRVDTGALAPPSGAHPEVTGLLYDGWLTSYWYQGALPPGATLSGKWVVPASPTGDPLTGTDPVTLYYFNGINVQVGEDAGGGLAILQPVLGYGSPWGDQWTITSWNCCHTGNGFTTQSIDVSPGDVIEGVTTGADCDSTVCQRWVVTSTDLTTGKSVVLNTTEPYPPLITNPAVLEVYGVTACDMLAPGGEETFFDNTVTADGGVVPLAYYVVANTSNPGTPTCGYGGTSFGDDFTLIYSTTPAAMTTATSLQTSAVTVLPGAGVTLTATVTGGVSGQALAGNVTFVDGTTALGTADVAAALDAGAGGSATASLPVTNLTGGVHTLTATYGGDDGYGVSTSAPITVTALSNATTTTLAPSASLANEGADVVVTGTVVGVAPDAGSPATPAPTGTLTFFPVAGSTGTVVALAPQPGDGGSPGAATASFTLSHVGTYSIMATYSGDAYYASSSASVTATIASTVLLSPTAPSLPPGGTVTFAASGNVGAVSWALQTNASGGQIDSTGRYTAGPAGSVTDVVVATDSLQATGAASVNVGAGVSLAPVYPNVAPLGTIVFATQGGTGTYSWAITSNQSNGTLTQTGTYVAGPTGGVFDVIQVTDTLGNTASTGISIDDVAPVQPGGAGSSSSSSGGGAVPDAGPGPSDAGAGDDAGARNGEAGGSGGCGCRAAGASATSRPNGMGVGALVSVVAVLARRRRRARRGISTS